MLQNNTPQTQLYQCLCPKYYSLSVHSTRAVDILQEHLQNLIIKSKKE